jgi:DNA-binding NarL/FixJ family response regulator
MKKFYSMILEDDPVTSIALAKALHLAMQDELVLTARTVAEARLLLEEYEIDFFVLDVNLPDGSGIDFLMEISAKNPSAAVIIMTAQPLPEYRDQAEAYGALRFMEKPVHYMTVAALARDCRAALATQTRGNTGFFAAALTRLTVLDIVQLKCLNNATQVIDFTSSQGGRGRVHFQNGEIIHATTAKSKGEAAISEIIGWRGGRAQEVVSAQPVERTIFKGWQSLLLNAAQSADENRAS